MPPILFAASLLLATSSLAQESVSAPVLQQRETAVPRQQPVPAQTGAQPGDIGLSGWQQSHLTMFATDYGQLARYRAENAALGAARPDERRIIFFGDSITDFWKLDRSFPGKGYINRGIGGQTTSQMLVRFRQDVINLQPLAVVILAGTNDIAGNSGPIALADIESNYATFAELARAHGVHVVFSSVTPVHNYTERSKPMFAGRPIPEILELNAWLKNYCSTQGETYIDYYSAMVDERGMMRAHLAEDGLHPNEAGYAIMGPLAEAAIEKSLRVRP